MKCPNCYNENEPGAANCKYCGTALPEIITTQEVSNNNEDNEVREEVNPGYQNFSTYGTPEIEPEFVREEVKVNGKSKKTKTKKKGSKAIVLVFFMLILIAALAGGVYYYITLTTPEQIYKKAIEEGLDTVINSEVYDVKSSQLDAKVRVEAPDKSIAGSLNGFKFDTTVAFDLRDEQALVKLKVDHEEQAYLNATVFGDLKREKIYFGDATLFDRLLNEDIPQDLINIIEENVDFKALSTRDTAQARSNISQVLIASINENIKVENIERTSAKITYNGKNKSVKDHVLILTEGDIKTLVTNVLTDLKSNDTFLKSFDVDKEDIVDYIDDILDEVKYFNDDEDVETPNKIIVHLYTSGLMYEPMGIAVEVIPSDDSEKIVAKTMKTADDRLELNFKQIVGEEVTEYTVKTKSNVLEDGTTDLEVEYIDGEESVVTVKANYTLTMNEPIDDVDTQGSIKYSELKKSDFETIMNNIDNSPIYTIVYGLMNYVEQNGIDLNFGTGVNAETALPNNVKLEPNQSYIITKNDGIAVFEVPTAFETEHNGNQYKVYIKNNRIGDKSQLYINAISGKAKSIVEAYIKDYDFLYEKKYRTEIDERGKEYQVEEPSIYSNIEISQVREEIVNGNTYYRLDVKYVAKGSIKNNITYYATQLNDDYAFVVRVEDPNQIITDVEKEKILTITKY